VGNYLDLPFDKAIQNKEGIIHLVAQRHDFAGIRLIGQAAGIHIAYFVGEKMTPFEMVESLFQVADRKGKFNQLIEQLISPGRNGSSELKQMLGISNITNDSSKVVETQEPTRRVFLSHSSVDKPFVRMLQQRLMDDGFPSWMDEVEIRVGFSLRRSIESGIVESSYFVIVLSPDAVESQWVQRELDVALLREIRERNIFLLPVLYKECNIPPMIAPKKYADFRTSFDSGYTDLLEALK